MYDCPNHKKFFCLVKQQGQIRWNDFGGRPEYYYTLPVNSNKPVFLEVLWGVHNGSIGRVIGISGRLYHNNGKRGDPIIYLTDGS